MYELEGSSSTGLASKPILNNLLTVMYLGKEIHHKQHVQKGGSLLQIQKACRNFFHLIVFESDHLQSAKVSKFRRQSTQPSSKKELLILT